MTKDDRNMKSRPSKAGRRVTAMDVAMTAGVSRSAVSRAFSQSSYLDPEKRRHIIETASAMGYRPNALAAGLGHTRTNLIGVVAGNFGNLHDAQVLSQMVSGLTAAGRWPVVLDSSGTDGHLSSAGVFNYPLDAMIIRGGSVDQAVLRTCDQLRIPLIYIGCVVDAPRVDSIVCDDITAVRQLTRLVLERGRKRIAYMGGPRDWASQRRRHRGLTEEMNRWGLSPVAVAHADFTYDGGNEAARNLWSSARPDAIVCANDAMALGALDFMRSGPNLSVPQDISVTGFDDIAMASWPCFQLTTAKNSVSATVSEALRLLDERIAFPDTACRLVKIEAPLVLRNTH